MFESRSTADGITPAKIVGSIDAGSDVHTEQKPICRTMHVYYVRTHVPFMVHEIHTYTETMVQPQLSALLWT